MKWIETIEIRTVGGDQALLEEHLDRLLEEIKKAKQVRKVTIYRRLLIDTDYKIHLHHESTKAESNGSQLGLRIVAALKDFGMVNHSIWFEIHRSQDIYQTGG